MLVNAAGAWAGQIATACRRVLHMSPGKGSMLIMNRRHHAGLHQSPRAPGRWRHPAPVHTVSILGTTDVTVPDPDDAHVTADEVQALLADGTAWSRPVERPGPALLRGLPPAV